MPEEWNAIIAGLLSALKIDLGITTNAYDERFVQYIRSSYEAITEEGIVLDVTSMKDQQLVVLYSAWMWRKRDNGEGMPRMIRYALNNRLFSQKMRNVT
jgi:hypothetical protein